VAKNIAQESNKNVIKTNRPHETTAAHFDRRKMPGRCFVLDGTTRAVVVNKVMTNCTTGTPILHAEASFSSAEREDCAKGS